MSTIYPPYYDLIIMTYYDLIITTLLIMYNIAFLSHCLTVCISVQLSASLTACLSVCPTAVRPARPARSLPYSEALERYFG